MSTIRIHRTLESDTLHLPELRPLIGKTVDITVTEAPAEKTKDWTALEAIARQNLIDAEAIEQYREFNRQHNQPPLP